MALRFIKLDEAARILGVSVDDVNAMRERHELHGYRDGSTWKFKETDIERAKHSLAERGPAAEPEAEPMVEPEAEADDVSFDMRETVDDIEAKKQQTGTSEAEADLPELESPAPQDSGELTDLPIEMDAPSDDVVLLSEVELGESDPNTSSTIIGKPGEQRGDESDIQIITDDDRQRRGAEQKPAVPTAKASPPAVEPDAPTVIRSHVEPAEEVDLAPSLDEASGSKTGHGSGVIDRSDEDEVSLADADFDLEDSSAPAESLDSDQDSAAVISVLVDGGLDTDEAFLVAVKRMGDLDALSREFAREHSDRLWKQLVVPTDAGEPRAPGRKDAIVAFCLAVAAGALVKLPALFGIQMEDENAGFYIRNASFFVLPILTGYFVWKRGFHAGTVRWLAVGFAAAAVFANVYPFTPEGNTEVLTALHLPIALWLAVGIAYAGGRWGQVAGRMDFIRFTGELFIYYVLIALGGGVLTGFMAMLFETIGVDPETFLAQWLVPCGAVGAVLVGSWLVEAKQSVIENMAPVLTRLFTPLFAAMLITFLATLIWTGGGLDIERDLLIAFDLLLVVVLGLLLYSISARDPRSPPGIFDVLQVVLVVSALLADGVALWAIAARITEFGFTPNRVAALGENVILLVNLAWSAVLYIRFLTRRGSFSGLERWQTGYMPVYAVWAAIVVIVFPPLFGYI